MLIWFLDYMQFNLNNSYRLNFHQFITFFLKFVILKTTTMVTITLKINEKTNFGKTFLAFLKTLIAKEKSVEVLKVPNAETLKVMQDIENGIGINKTKNSADLFKQLGI